MIKLSKNEVRLHRKKRILVNGTEQKPRISVYRSLCCITAQLIDDQSGKTIVSASSKEVKSKKFDMSAAKEVGMLVAKKAKEKGIELAVFDRGGYRYHGKVKALAEGAREGGLKF